MVPEECMATTKPAFDQIASRYLPASGKLHIADLAPEQQEEIRNELFGAIKNKNSRASGMQSSRRTASRIIKLSPIQATQQSIACGAR